MNIGASWIKKTQDGKNYMSCVIEIPIIGKLQFAMFKNEKKENDSQPDYNLVWNPPREGKGSAPQQQSSQFSDQDIPF